MLDQLTFPASNEAKLFFIKNSEGEFLRFNRNGQAFWVADESKAAGFQYRYRKDTEKKLRENGLVLSELIFDTNIESGWAF